MIKPCQSYGIHLCEEDLELVRALANSAGEVILSTFSTFKTFSKLSTLTALSALLLLVLIKIRPFPSLHHMLQRWPSPVSTSSQTSFIHLYGSISPGRGNWSKYGIFLIFWCSCFWSFRTVEKIKLFNHSKASKK